MDLKNEMLLIALWLLIAISNIVALSWLHSDPTNVGAFIIIIATGLVTLYLRLCLKTEKTRKQ